MAIAIPIQVFGSNAYNSKGRRYTRKFFLELFIYALMNHFPKGQVDAGMEHFFCLGQAMQPVRLGAAFHHQQAPVLQLHGDSLFFQLMTQEEFT